MERYLPVFGPKGWSVIESSNPTKDIFKGTREEVVAKATTLNQIEANVLSITSDREV